MAVAVDVFSPGSFCLSSFADSATIVANAAIETAVTASAIVIAVDAAANAAVNAALNPP